ncbi:11417_t:CDS:1, partial [Funneliformis caledonium]
NFRSPLANIEITAALVASGFIATSVWAHVRNKNEKDKENSIVVNLSKNLPKTSSNAKGLKYLLESDNVQDVTTSSSPKHIAKRYKTEEREPVTTDISFISARHFDAQITTKVRGTVQNNPQSNESSLSRLSSQLGIKSHDKECISQNDHKPKRSSKSSRQLIAQANMVSFPVETATDVLIEFRCCHDHVLAFIGQDLIEFEDYDEEDDLRQLLT